MKPNHDDDDDDEKETNPKDERQIILDDLDAMLDDFCDDIQIVSSRCVEMVQHARNILDSLHEDLKPKKPRGKEDFDFIRDSMSERYRDGIEYGCKSAVDCLQDFVRCAYQGFVDQVENRLEKFFDQDPPEET